MTRCPRSVAAAVAIAASVASIAAGCGNAGGGSQTGGSAALGHLANATYLSTRVTTAGQPRSLVDGTQISLRFWDSRLSASAGCNTLGGAAALRDGVIAVDGGLSTTEMGCADPLMRQDGWLADLLGSSPAASLDDDRLTLTSGDTVVEFRNEETANPDRPLTATTWTLESIGSTGADGSIGSVPAGVESTLAIGGDGRVSVRPGCNSGGGQATVADDTIDFGPIALTRMACAGPEMDVEDVVVGVLGGTVSYTVDGDTLTLTKGDATLTYRRGDGAGRGTSAA